MSANLVLYEKVETVDACFEAQLTRRDAAQELGVSERVFYNKLMWAIQRKHPFLCVKYGNSFAGSNRRKIDQSDLVYIQEVIDLLKKFTDERVINILNRKYNCSMTIK